MDFMIFHDIPDYSRTCKTSKMFKENALGIGNDLNRSRKSIPDVLRMVQAPIRAAENMKNHENHQNPLIFNEIH